MRKLMGITGILFIQIWVCHSTETEKTILKTPLTLNLSLSWVSNTHQKAATFAATAD